MSELLFISIVIPVYNRKDFLSKAISSLFDQSYPKDKYEIVIVDDGSTEQMAELVRAMQKGRLCKLKYYYQENKGPAAARNLGIKNASGEIIAFTDSDCIVHPDWLTEITRGYDNQNVAGIGGMIKPIATNSVISQYCAYTRMNDRPDFIENTEFIYLVTGNASFRKDYLIKVNGFDERYNSPGGEDPDICYRLQKLGHILVYNPQAIVFNPHKQSLKEFMNTYFNYGKGVSFLSLRRLSKWELLHSSGLIWFLCFLKAIGIMSMICVNSFLVMFRLSLRIPFRILSLYSKEGLGMEKSISYASLDFIKMFSFRQGRIWGYIVGKFKGFSIYN